ncbi:protein-tyrosine-phosphatase [Mycolicibacterium parafortuitum]|uniref:protein-tyrosine-phosphatase n=1 Tax=Mycolicibacterium parafortuitum TaxID=39692 RepID=A0A7I7TW92_MYCPF|nr:tyrosine-protein phosphatase [Mycolicibacterium parafortuitum]BBY73204.1 protein-tyrosine-phosphatase [Mycolicibacterium parafortuitum]
MEDALQRYDDRETAEIQRPGPQNIREVHGYAGSERIRSGILWRSDAPAEGDSQCTADHWPPATVIDLRSPTEYATSHPLEDFGVRVHRIPLSSRLNLTSFDATHVPAVGGIGSLYIAILDGARDAIVEALEVLAGSKSPILVHCAAGKDRTGILIATVLAALGVERRWIVADYIETESNMTAVMSRIEQLEPDTAAKLRALLLTIPEALSAPAEAIETVLDMYEERGGAASWLLASGLRPETLAILRDRILEPCG